MHSVSLCGELNYILRPREEATMFDLYFVISLQDYLSIWVPTYATTVARSNVGRCSICHVITGQLSFSLVVFKSKHLFISLLECWQDEQADQNNIEKTQGKYVCFYIVQ